MKISFRDVVDKLDEMERNNQKRHEELKKLIDNMKITQEEPKEQEASDQEQEL